MRVRCGYYYTTYYTLSDVPPCGNIDYSEAEDYTFNVVYLDPCTSTVEAGTLVGSEVCPSTSFTITNSGFTLASGFEVTWQKRSPSGTGLWTTIPGAIYASAYTEAAGITEPTDYRLILNCTATGSTDTTTVLTVGIAPYTECYCIPTHSSGCLYGDDISHFTFDGETLDIDNPDVEGCPPSSYADLTDSFIANVVPTLTYSGTIESSYSGAYEHAAIWVDWNTDGIFSPTEQMVAESGAFGGGVVATFSFTVPFGVAPGNKVMRVRSNYYSVPVDPCTIVSYGESHDYSINVIELDPCSDPSIVFPTEANALSTPAAVCGTGDVTLSSNSRC